jgi:hypothetical protein
MRMTGSARDEVRRRWAAKQLGVSPDVAADEARSVFLRRLPREDFVPDPSLWTAARCLGVGGDGAGATPRAEMDATREQEEALSVEIEDFANNYWTMPSADRRARWQVLSARAAPFLPLRARLKCLEGGLDVATPELPAGTDPRVADLTRSICELYVLRLAARSRAWQTQWRKLRWRISDWRRAADKLRDHYPAILALLPDVREKLSGWEPPSLHIAPPVLKGTEPSASSWRRLGLFLWATAAGAGVLAGFFSSSSQPVNPSRPIPSIQSDPILTGSYKIKDGYITMPNGVRRPLSDYGEATQRLLGVPKEEVQPSRFDRTTGPQLPPSTRRLPPKPPATAPSGKSP